MASAAPAEPKKKSWFARHKFLTAILVIVAIAIIGGVAGGGDDDAEQTTTGQTASDSAAPAAEENSDEAEAPDNADAGEAEDAEAPEDAEAAPAGVGTAVNTGDFDVTVTSVETGVTAVGDQYLNAEPSGQFVLVRVTVANTSNEAEYFNDSDQSLIDEQGRKHSTSSDALYLDDTTFFLEKINPGVTVEGVLLYDIPADAVPASLELASSDFFGDPILVSLK